LDEVDDTSIFKTGHPVRYLRSPPWLLCSWTSRTPQRAIAQRFSALALNGRAGTHQICPLMKVNRPCHRAAVTSQFDPMRNSSQATKTARFCSAVGFGLLGREIILGGSRAS
jgi:hypothetical protein